MSAVVLLAHGSPDPRSGSAARRLATVLESRSFDTVYRAAFLQHEGPTLEDAVVDLAADGHAGIIVVPAFLMGAFHVGHDVPVAVAAAEEAVGRHIEVTDPIGPDAALLRALDHSLPGGPAVLATAGTSDPDALQSLERLATTWSEQRQALVMLAHASQSTPDVATALAQLEGATGARASVGSYVLFPGVLPDRIAGAAGDRPVSDPLVAAPELLGVVESRILAARRRAA